jgi:hypothetical protein
VAAINDYPVGPVRDWEPRRRCTGEGVPFMTGPERDALIVRLRRKRWSYARIGAACGMSANGVMLSLRRIAEGRPGRDPRG